MRRRWAIVVAGIVVGVCLSTLYLALVPPYYEATALLAPGGSSPATSSAGSGPLAALAGLSNTVHQITPFEDFQATLTSIALARNLGQQEWVLKFLFGRGRDSATHQWVRPTGSIANVKAMVHRFFGRAAWQPPGDVQIARALQAHLSVKYDRLTDLMHAEFTASSPVMAQRMLSAVLKESDELVRKRSNYEAQHYVAFADQQFQTVTNADQRAALSNIETEYERILILSGVDVPFATTVIDPPTVSQLPTGPRISIVMAMGLILGALVGIALTLLFPVRHR
ncbi:MAG: hypothetical protein ACREFD_18135 [Stellaceae bacterium]